MRCSHRPDGGFRNRRPRGGYSDRDMPGAVHGLSYTKSSEHPNQKGSVLGFCPRTAEHRYPCARLAHCRNPNVGVPEFTYQRPYWRERLGGKRRRRTRCELCWGNGRSPTHLPGLRCVGLSGRLSATVVPQNRVCKYYAAVLLHQYLKLDIRSAAKFREASRDARPKARSSTPNKLIIFPFQKVPPSPFIWIKNEAEEVDNGPPAHQQ